MRGLTRYPTIKELEFAYNKLVGKKGTETDLSLWSQWSRLDPRLAEILVQFFAKHWKQLSPISLNQAILQQPWPSALGVLLLSARMSVSELSLFDAWKNLVMNEVKPADGELFFIGTRAFGGAQAFKDALLSHKIYRRWGYLGRDLLYNKANFSNQTRVSAHARRLILRQLMKEKKYFKVNDYIEALEGHVSRRQAELDLKGDKRLRTLGQTKGRLYVVIR